MSEQIRPALTPEEWGWKSYEGTPMSDGQLSASLGSTGAMELGFTDIYEITTPERHALAALCLHGQPFGFTRDDVVDVRHMADVSPELLKLLGQAGVTSPELMAAVPAALLQTAQTSLARRPHFSPSAARGPMTRTCAHCRETKPLGEFEKKAGKPHGRGYRCRPCAAARVRRYYRAHPDERRAYAKKRESALGPRPRKRPTHAENKARAPDRTIAHWKVANAIKGGTLVRPSTCEKCGDTGRIHAHHDDYSKPLNIRWLCHDCHMAVHRRVNPISLLPPDGEKP